METQQHGGEPMSVFGEVVLDVRGLQTYLYTRWGTTKAVDGVSFQVRERETLGLVGESGCGKSMTALSLLRLAPKPAARIVGGQILLDGEDLLRKSEKEMRKLRGRRIFMILQDPQTSLNPVFTIGNQLFESILPGKISRKPPGEPHDKTLGARSKVQRAIEALRTMSVSSPESRLHNYPHEMSGGMKQRVVAAMGILSQPRLLIADEPTTALDVTVQAQYLRLLKRLQQETGVAILFITHDFGVVARMCDRVAVMYAGRIVEQGTVRGIFNRPAHPYTQALLASVPRMEERIDQLYSIEGQPPALHDLPPGCHFAPRCAHLEDRCRRDYPPRVEVEPNHTASCWKVSNHGD